MSKYFKVEGGAFRKDDIFFTIGAGGSMKLGIHGKWMETEKVLLTQVDAVELVQDFSTTTGSRKLFKVKLKGGKGFLAVADNWSYEKFLAAV